MYVHSMFSICNRRCNGFCTSSQHRRLTRQFAAPFLLNREMPLEQCAYLLDAQEYPRFIPGAPELSLHALADGFPLFGMHPGVHTSVRDDFHIAVREQEIDEYAIVMLGVPDPKFRKDVNSA